MIVCLSFQGMEFGLLHLIALWYKGMHIKDCNGSPDFRVYKLGGAY